MIIADAQQGIHQGLGFVSLWGKSTGKQKLETLCTPFCRPRPY